MRVVVRHAFVGEDEFPNANFACSRKNCGPAHNDVAYCSPSVPSSSTAAWYSWELSLSNHSYSIVLSRVRMRWVLSEISCSG